MNDYHDKITELFDEYYSTEKVVKLTPNKRIDNANAIIEDYIERHGKRPPASVLSRLATYILLDILSDSHPDKITREEYPIMTARQRRRRDEPPSKNVYFDKRDYTGFRTVFEKSDSNGAGYVKRYPIYNALTDENAEEQDAGIDVLSLIESAGLTDRQREAIELVYFEDMTQENAGKSLGISRNSVDTHVRIALNKIKSLIS